MFATRPAARATVVIATKNRKDELRRALLSTVTQSAPVEVIVMDDGSTDRSAEMVRVEFSCVRVERSEVSQGYIAQRNRAAELASTSFIFSLDDDAEFSTPRVVEQTLGEFDDPRVGAIAIPYLEPLKSNFVMQQAPSHDRVWVTDSFVGTAHALRRALFLQLGGYRELVHQGEERDYCVRMLEVGSAVRLGQSEPIYHYESPRRDFRRMDFYGRRNDVLFAWHNAPSRWLPVHLVATTLNGVRSAYVAGRCVHMFAGTFVGYAECVRRWSERLPVSGKAYEMSRRLRKRGPLPIDDVVGSSAIPPAPADGI